MGGGGGRREDISFFLSVSRSMVGPDDPSPEEKSWRGIRQTSKEFHEIVLQSTR